MMRVRDGTDIKKSRNKKALAADQSKKRLMFWISNLTVIIIPRNRWKWKDFFTSYAAYLMGSMSGNFLT